MDIDSTPIGIGKYKYLTPNEVSEADPEYIVWLYDTIKPKRCSKELRDACEQDFHEMDTSDPDWFFDQD